jgi:putative DNA primase/helicase
VKKFKRSNAAEHLMTMVQLSPKWSDEVRRELELLADTLKRQEDAAKDAKRPGGAKPLITPNLTDVGNSLRFTMHHGDTSVHCQGLGAWFHWSGRHWEEDRTNKVYMLAKQVARSIQSESRWQDVQVKRLKTLQEIEGNHPERQIQIGNTSKSSAELSKFSLKTEASARLEAMIKLAKAEIPIRTEQLDKDPYLFNCLNGTIDLKTGTFREHRPADYITRIAPVMYDAKAECPKFCAALQSIFPESPMREDAPGDGEMIAFVRRLLAMCLSGDTTEQVLIIFHGVGSNGKSLFLETICGLLGPYAGPSPEGLLLARRNQQHPTELANLFGMRLVHSTETGEGARLDEPRVKRLTGSDTIKARHCFEDFFSFTPTHKLVISTNHRPKIRGTDHAIWRRVILVPFTAKFWDANEPAKHSEPRLARFQKRKELMREKFTDERPGILNWLLAGFRDWLENGLQPPVNVKAVNEEYRREEDVVAQFVEEFCDLSDRGDMRVESGHLYATFVEVTGVKMYRRDFTQRIIAITGFDVRISNGKRWIPGIRLRIKPESSGEEDNDDNEDVKLDL